MSTRDLKASVPARSSIKAKDRRKHNLAPQHLRAAMLFAGEAQAIEAATQQPDETQSSKHRAYVTGAVLSAVAFLEAAINELYSSEVDQAVEDLPQNTGRLFSPRLMVSDLWARIKGRDSVLCKYQLALRFADKQKFNRGQPPCQDVVSVIKLRDALVHYKPEWDDEYGNHQKLEERLRKNSKQYKFKLNPFVSAGSLWFPHQCLGAGCAQWSVEAVRKFSDEFCDRLGIPRHSV